MTPFTGPSYLVDVTLNKCPITTYIDTGSVVSLVTEDFVTKKLDLIIRPLSDFGEVDMTFRTANGESLV